MREYKDWYWLNDESRKFLNNGYIPKDVDIIEHFKNLGLKAEKILNKPGFADKFNGYLAKGYYLLPTPTITNFLSEKDTTVSCFGSVFPDSIQGIMDTNSEIGVMSQIGGGTSGTLHLLRPRGTKVGDGQFSTSGAPSFMPILQATVGAVSQKNRRGHFCPTLPIEHGDIEEFLDFRSEGNPIQHLSFSVSVTRKWIKDMKAGDPDKRRIWAKLINSRMSTGFPYIHFYDNVNDVRPKWFKDNNLLIHHANMCQEISLYNTEDESFTCVLGSLNLLHWDELKDTDAIETLAYFIDATITDFLEKVKGIKHMERAVRFTEKNRAIGIGVSGYHSLLQSKMIPFDSLEARFENNSIFKEIEAQCLAANIKAGEELGSPELLVPYKLRWSTTNALMPNTSSAFIVGQVSQSVEPFINNFYIKDVSKNKIELKNIFLMELLELLGKNTKEVWISILKNEGSVQHLDFLNDRQKAVFKTFFEIEANEIIIQTAHRQKFIDQSQSINLIFHANESVKKINEVILKAEEMGVKNLYYHISESSAQAFTNKIAASQCESCAS
jgi:ribonucleoside-diphosphate reductase alpha chain